MWGQFVHCQLPPPPVNKTGATALPHMGIGMSLRADDDDGIPFHFDAADAEDSDEGAEEDETGHGENRHLLLVIIGIVTISIIVIIVDNHLDHLNRSEALSLLRLCQRDFSNTKAGQWQGR